MQLLFIDTGVVDTYLRCGYKFFRNNFIGKGEYRIFKRKNLLLQREKFGVKFLNCSDYRRYQVAVGNRLPSLRISLYQIWEYHFHFLCDKSGVSTIRRRFSVPTILNRAQLHQLFKRSFFGKRLDIFLQSFVRRTGERCGCRVDSAGSIGIGEARHSATGSVGEHVEFG